MKRLPNDAEIQRAAEQLTAEGSPGLLDAHGRVRADKRSAVAATLQTAVREERAQKSKTDRADEFAAEIKRMEQALDATGVRYETTAAVIGAISASLWRGMREQETAHGKATDHTGR